MIEAFFEAHQHTISALTAGGTLAAVLVSLYLALHSRWEKLTRLKAHVSQQIIIHDSVNKQNPPTYLAVNIVNVGVLALRIPFSFFYWKIPFEKGMLLVTPLDGFSGDPFISPVRYPVEIPARASHIFFVSKPTLFLDELGARLSKRGKLVDALRLRLIRAMVATDDGRRFRAKINSKLKREIIAGVKTRRHKSK